MNSFTCFSFGRPLWELWAIYFFHKRLGKTTGNGDFSLEDCWLLISLVWWVLSTSCCLFLWVWQLCLLFVCFIISVHFCILPKMWNFKYGHSHFPFNRPFFVAQLCEPLLASAIQFAFSPYCWLAYAEHWQFQEVLKEPVVLGWLLHPTPFWGQLLASCSDFYWFFFCFFL